MNVGISGVSQDELASLEGDAGLTMEQRIKILEVWMAKMLPLIMGYVDKDGEAVPGIVRRVASLEAWVKIGVCGGGFMSIISTFGLAEPIKKLLAGFLLKQ